MTLRAGPTPDFALAGRILAGRMQAQYEKARSAPQTSWDDEPRPTEVLALDGNPLLGMMPLDGSHLHVEATEGGEVIIEPL